MSEEFILDGTDREVVQGFQEVPTLVSPETIQVSFWLAENGQSVQEAAFRLMAQPLRDRKYCSAEQLQAKFGADPKTVQAVRKFAATYDLTLVPCADNARLVTMSVPLNKVKDLFGVDLKTYASKSEPGRSYRGRTGKIALPKKDFPEEAHAKNILAVFGLDNRRQARAFAQNAPESVSPIATQGGSDAVALEAPAAAFIYPPAVYGFPSAPPDGAGPETGQILTGSGQNIGVIGFGDTFDASLLAGTLPPNQITIAPPQQISQHDDRFRTETTMDVKILFACAPQAHFTVFAFDETSHGWTTGLHGILRSPSIPSVLSISWGWPEKIEDPHTCLWTKAAIDAIEDLLAGLALRGVSVVVSSGDGGIQVQYPASSAFVLTCGGTQNPQNPKAEAVWSDTKGASGGGISSVIPMPDWQVKANIAFAGVNVPTVANMRSVPDVAAWAIYFSGLEGTSAATPLWAGLLALANQYFQRQQRHGSQTSRTVGNINALLYDKKTNLWKTFNDIECGNNSTSATNATPGNPPYYQATKGWDACTGWGSPRAMEFIETLVGTGSPVSA